jgi:hypothetical protein
MKVTYTDAGTPVIERTSEEYAAHLERETQAAVGMSVAEFTEAYLTGKIDHSHPAAGQLVGLLRIGQNGQNWYRPDA